jgi:hypothetical protein
VRGQNSRMQRHIRRAGKRLDHASPFMKLVLVGQNQKPFSTSIVRAVTRRSRRRRKAKQGRRRRLDPYWNCFSAASRRLHLSLHAVRSIGRSESFQRSLATVDFRVAMVLLQKSRPGALAGGGWNVASMSRQPGFGARLTPKARFAVADHKG